ncbi:ATP-binding protein [Elongatibacter sediminis]|uniref:histidine kinase n=1 Tax=Elongatibacter sediminis TaxID=3119006 RepID=A0AAW9RCG4_9GAMM
MAARLRLAGGSGALAGADVTGADTRARDPRDKSTPRRSLRQMAWRTLPPAALLVALLAALLLVGGVLPEGDGTAAALLDEYYLWVLGIAAVALLALFWSIVSRLISLIRKVRNATPGARLSARWVRNFLILSLPPALIVYFFSAWFLTSSIDSWFDVEVERALEDSLALGQEFLDTRTLEVRNQLLEISDEIQLLQDDGEALRRRLLSRVRATGPVELSVLEPDGAYVATATIDPLIGLPERPGDFALLQASDRGEYAAAEPTGDGSLQIRVIVRMPAPYPGRSPRLLQAIYPLPADITALTGSVEQEYYRYQNVAYLRESLKQSFLLILSLVLLLTILLAILAALNAARRMVAPLSRLSAATRDVAGGDFDRQVEAGERDEIGFLVASFNDMTQALKRASQSAEESRAKLQAQGDYLETVLGSLSSGVLTLDASEQVLRANAACRAILGLDGLAPGGRLGDLIASTPGLEPFADAIRQQTERGRTTWQQEIRLQRDGAPLVLLARGSRLQDGMVIVFDDVTVLNLAQREAAWAEAARRLAHEVKNPLTPIRLAAERLRMKLADKLEADDSRVLDRAADTIVAQVEALRTLVDAFGDYAREPVLSRDPVRLDELIREVVALYQQGDTAGSFELDLRPGPDGLAADSGRLRQMLHNLIRNAREAGGDSVPNIRISTTMKSFEGQSWLKLEIEDSGPGFPAEILERPFEPHVSRKSGGSGLGLAICRKIVTEHDGRITLANAEHGAGRVTILLPLEVGASNAPPPHSGTAQ